MLGDWPHALIFAKTPVERSVRNVRHFFVAKIKHLYVCDSMPHALMPTRRPGLACVVIVRLGEGYSMFASSHVPLSGCSFAMANTSEEMLLPYFQSTLAVTETSRFIAKDDTKDTLTEISQELCELGQQVAQLCLGEDENLESGPTNANFFSWLRRSSEDLSDACVSQECESRLSSPGRPYGDVGQLQVDVERATAAAPEADMRGFNIQTAKDNGNIEEMLGGVREELLTVQHPSQNSGSQDKPLSREDGKFPISEHGRCSHVESWTRLRGKRGHSYFFCKLCGVCDRLRMPCREDTYVVVFRVYRTFAHWSKCSRRYRGFGPTLPLRLLMHGVHMSSLAQAPAQPERPNSSPVGQTFRHGMPRSLHVLISFLGWMAATYQRAEDEAYGTASASHPTCHLDTNHHKRRRGARV